MLRSQIDGNGQRNIATLSHGIRPKIRPEKHNSGRRRRPAQSRWRPHGITGGGKRIASWPEGHHHPDKGSKSVADVLQHGNEDLQQEIPESGRKHVSGRMVSLTIDLKSTGMRKHKRRAILFWDIATAAR